jgi:hypothetical protein
MDFRQSSQTNQARPTVSGVASASPEHKPERDSGFKKKKSGNWLGIITAVLLIGVAVLIAAIALAFTGSKNDNEFKYVNSSKYQAVFLNNGQVYFGNIDNLNDQYVRLTNVYYLTQSGDSTSSNYSLVKLGCQQIHDPLDEMVVNRSQVTFWENLSNDGKVVKSIQQFKQQNPKGPDCSQVSNQTQASSNANTQGSSDTTGTKNTDTGTGSTTTK